MTELVLRRFTPEPALVLCRLGPSGAASPLEQRAPPAPVATIIGPPGSRGLQGHPGPQGPQSAPRRFDFTGAGNWIGEHDLGRTPVVLVYLDDGSRVVADVVATQFNFTVTHAIPRSGFVLLI